MVTFYELMENIYDCLNEEVYGGIYQEEWVGDYNNTRTKGKDELPFVLHEQHNKLAWSLTVRSDVQSARGTGILYHFVNSFTVRINVEVMPPRGKCLAEYVSEEDLFDLEVDSPTATVTLELLNQNNVPVGSISKIFDVERGYF